MKDVEVLQKQVSRLDEDIRSVALKVVRMPNQVTIQVMRSISPQTRLSLAHRSYWAAQGC